MRQFEQCRELEKPCVVQVVTCQNHDYFTLASVCSCEHKALKTRYAVGGTAYGYIHTTSGDVRLWGSYSGAYKGMHKHYDL